MVRNQQSKVTPHAIFGVFLALLGILFTLDNLGLANTASVIRFWPVLPITIGVIMLMQADTPREWVFGSAWMAAGGLVLARNLGWVSFELKDFLPLLLVALGVRLIWRERARAVEPAPPPWETDDLIEPEGEPAPADPGRPPPIAPLASAVPSAADVDGARDADSGEHAGWSGCDWRSADFTRGDRWRWAHWENWRAWRGRHWAPRRGHVQMLALMSGVERRLRAETFTSAELTAIMGACELDLRHARMAGPVAHISAFALWGGVEIRVPEHWVVVNRSMALMGGVEDTSRHVDSPERPRLFVHGFALMAGIEIKN